MSTKYRTLTDAELISLASIVAVGVDFNSNVAVGVDFNSNSDLVLELMLRLDGYVYGNKLPTPI